MNTASPDFMQADHYRSPLEKLPPFLFDRTARGPEVPPLPGLSCDYRLCFHGCRRGLRCGVPPGLPATWNWSTTELCYCSGIIPMSNADAKARPLPRSSPGSTSLAPLDCSL